MSKNAKDKPENWDEDKPKVEAQIAEIDMDEVKKFTDRGEVPHYNLQTGELVEVQNADGTFRKGKE